LYVFTIDVTIKQKLNKSQKLITVDHVEARGTLYIQIPSFLPNACHAVFN